MSQALKNVPVTEPPVPEGVINSGGEWYFADYAPGSGISSLGGRDEGTASQPQTIPLPAADEKRRILDLFKN